jgi:hypothetical protein
MIDLIYHEKFYAAYVYDREGKLVRHKVFTHHVDAAAWARRKAMGPENHPEAAPWCVRVYANESAFWHEDPTKEVPE